MKNKRKLLLISVIAIMSLSFIISMLTSNWGYFVWGLLPICLGGLYYFLELKTFIKKNKL